MIGLDPLERRTDASVRRPLGAQELEELAAQHDMRERGRRLRAFKLATEGKEWFHASNGTCLLIDKGLTGLARKRAAQMQSKSRRYRDKQIEKLMRAVKSA